MSETYRVARHPQHGPRWWPPGAAIPPENTDIRPATEAEIALMRRIEKHGNPPVAWGQKLADLMEGHTP